MNRAEEFEIGGLESEQVAVRSGIAPELEIVHDSFTEAERDGERGFVLNPADNLGDPVDGEGVIFAGLHDNGTVSQSDGLTSATEDFVTAHTVTRKTTICAAQSAVHTLTLTMAGDLDKSAQMDGVADKLFANRVGTDEKILQRRGPFLPEPLQDFEFA